MKSLNNAGLIYTPREQFLSSSNSKQRRRMQIRLLIVLPFICVSHISSFYFLLHLFRLVYSDEFLVFCLFVFSILNSIKHILLGTGISDDIYLYQWEFLIFPILHAGLNLRYFLCVKSMKERQIQSYEIFSKKSNRRKRWLVYARDCGWSRSAKSNIFFKFGKKENIKKKAATTEI